MKVTLRQILDASKPYLHDDFTLNDVKILIKEEFKVDDVAILTSSTLYDDTVINKKIKKCIDEPVAYINGHSPFFGLDFVVNKDVLIPRYETEELVKMVVDDLNKLKLDQPNIVEVGSGSGCIAISIDKNLTNSHKITSIEISKSALDVAKKNNKLLSANVDFIEGDCLDLLPKQNIDVLVSNPPYINKKTFVATRVLNNEPHLALFAEEEGLIFYRRMFEKFAAYNVKRAYFEISPDLKDGLMDLKEKLIPNYEISFYQDINKNLRMMKLVKKDGELIDFTSYKAEETLLDNHVLAFPTETVFGVGVVYDSQNAFNELCALKHRVPDKPFSVMLDSAKRISEFVDLTPQMERLINRFMPGEVTFLFPHRENLYPWVTLSSPYIGIRIPNSPSVIDLIKRVDKPLLVTSANMSGEKPLLDDVSCKEVFGEKLVAICKGKSISNLPSTIVLIAGDNLKLIREGSVSFKDIEEEWSK